MVSVDEEHADELETLVEVVGSPELVECAQQSIDEQMTPDSGVLTSELLLPEDMFQISVDNEADLGVGDASARLHLAFEAAFFGEPLAFDTTLLFARVDRTLVAVLTGHTGSSRRPSRGSTAMARTARPGRGRRRLTGRLPDCSRWRSPIRRSASSPP